MNIRAPSILTLVLFGVIAFATVYGWAFVQLYKVPHSYETASDWIYENIPAGSKLLGPHWDDRLPIDRPGRNPHQYEYECRECDLPFYEPDNLATLDTLIRRIATGDYIIFPTPRIQGSIPRIPNEYPHTTALLQLLWNGQIGYQIEHVVKAEPRAFGLTFNDDLADESFSVYDHPKVTILKNVGKFSPQEIRSRVLNSEAFGPLPSLNQILLTNSSEDASRYGPSSTTAVSQSLKTSFVVTFIALLCAHLYPKRYLLGIDRGVTLSLIVSPIFFGLGLGLAAWFLPIHLHDAAVRTLYVIGMIVALSLYIKRKSYILESSTEYPEIRCSPKLIIGVILVFILSGAIGGWISSTFAVNQSAFIGDLSALLALLRRAASSAVGIEVGDGSAGLPLVPFFLPLLWPLKVGGVAVSDTFSVTQGLLVSALAVAIFRVVLPKNGQISTRSLIARGALSTSLSLFFMHLCFFYILPMCVEVEPTESVRSESEVSEVAVWANNRIQGSPIFIEGTSSTGAQMVQRLGIPSFAFRPFGPKSVHHGITAALYESKDAEEAYRIAADNRIQLVIIGSLERATYSGESLEKFAQRPDLFAKVYGGKEVSIFAPATSPIFTASF